MEKLTIGDQVVKYKLNPEGEDNFRTQLIKNKCARRIYYFTDGTNTDDTWDISKFNKNTNIKSSISTAVTRIQKRDQKIVEFVLIKIKSKTVQKPYYLKKFDEQIEKLFPGYFINVEEKLKKDDLVLMENEDNSKVIIIKINKDKAEVQCFHEISKIMAELKGKYPEKIIEGIIIGQSIDNYLKKICSSNPLISLKQYKMNITLTEVSKE